MNTLEAHNRIAGHLLKTPLLFSDHLSSLFRSTFGSDDTKIFLKLESEQLTGSFKARGAYNKVVKFKGQNKLFTTASTGNHAAGVASALKKFGEKGIIYLPTTAAQSKIQSLERMVEGCPSIELRFHGSDCVEAEREARRVAEQTGGLFISPYNDEDVVAGQGTIGVEILEQFQQQSSGSVDFVLVPVGGGGLIGGIASHVKQTDPSIQVIGCQPKNDNAMQQCVAAGRIFDIEAQPTLSDGTAGNIEEGSITLELCTKYVDKFCTVSEEEIAQGVLRVLDLHHKLVEGAAGCGIAALFQEDLAKLLAGKNVVVVICGGNLGTEKLKSLLQSR